MSQVFLDNILYPKTNSKVRIKKNLTWVTSDPITDLLLKVEKLWIHKKL